MDQLPPLPFEPSRRRTRLRGVRRLVLTAAAAAGAVLGLTCVSQNPQGSGPVEEMAPPRVPRRGGAGSSTGAVPENGAAESAPPEAAASGTPEVRALKLVGHWDALTAGALSADGATAATGGADMTIRVWDLAGQRPTKRLVGHKQPVTAVALTPKGTRLLSGSRDRTVRLWDVAMSHEIKHFEGHSRAVTAVALGPGDGDRPERAASGDAGGGIRLWDLERGTFVASLVAHVQEINALMFSADGKRLVSAGDDGLTFIWNAQTGKPEHGLRGHRGWVMSLAISAAGDRLATGGADGTIRLWDLKSGQSEGILAERQGTVEQLTFGENDEHVIASLRSSEGQGLLRAWRLSDRRLVAGFPSHKQPVLALTWVSDGGRLESVGSDELALIRTLGALK